jgi:NADH-quinone oxidoreductase subunit M
MGLRQSGRVMLGIRELRELSLEGAILMAIGLSVTLSGLLILVTSLKQRTGTTDIARFGGLVRQIPRLSSWFLLFGIATFGLPGSVAFVAGDLVMHDTFNIHPAMAAIVLAGTVLNSVTLVRAWSLTFLGNDNHALSIARQVHLADLIPREQYVVLGLASIALLGGLMPGRVLSVEQDFVEQTLQQSGLQDEDHGGHDNAAPSEHDENDEHEAEPEPAEDEEVEHTEH